MDVPSVKCLYYPYSRCKNINSLKKAVLLFDEVGFIDSISWWERQGLFFDEQGLSFGENDLVEIIGLYQFLLDEGIISIIDSKELLQKFDNLLMAAIANDIKDDKFCEISIAHEVDDWSIFAERLPPSFSAVFSPRSGMYLESITLQALINANGDFNKVGKTYYDDVNWRWEKWKHLEPKSVKENAWGYLNRWIIGGDLDSEVYQVPFLQSSSLRINEALLVCATQNYIPLTDSGIHNNLMNLKVGRASNLLSDIELRQRLEIDLPFSLPQTHLAMAILDHLVSETELAKMTMKDIVRYRKQHKEQLIRFREKLAELASEIEKVEHNSNYYIELKKIVASKVIPEISKARDELSTKSVDVFSSLLLQSGQVIAPTLMATIFGGLGFWEILGACAIAEIGMFTTQGANNLIQLWQAHRQDKHGGFSYILNLA